MGKVRQSKNKLKGLSFGRLTVIEETAKRGAGQVVWLCRCECGNEVEVRSGNLRSGNTKSCGCFHRDKAREAKLTHGRTANLDRPVEYLAWWSMIARCKYESSSSYQWYGAKGIKVCEQWQGKEGFSSFIKDMGEHPGKGWSLDRIDPDKDYMPSNCRWLPIAENIARAHRKEAA